MGKIDKQLLGRGTAHIYIQLIVPAISGYVFWIILSHIVSSYVIGTLSTIIDLTEILSVIASIGTHDSIQRFLGRTLSEKNVGDSRMFVSAYVTCITLGIIISSFLILFAGSLFEIPDNNTTIKSILILLVVSTTFRILLSSIVISSFRTNVLTKVAVVSTAAKIGLSMILVLNGADIVELSLSYIFFGDLLTSVLVGIVAIRLLRQVPKKESGPKISFIHAFRNILTGGVATWIPSMVTTLGVQLGTVVIFGSKGSGDTAVYFISLSLVNVVLFGTTSLNNIAKPKH